VHYREDRAIVTFSFAELPDDGPTDRTGDKSADELYFGQRIPNNHAETGNIARNQFRYVSELRKLCGGETEEFQITTEHLR